MAANSFASTLRWNTHRMAGILVFTALEWTLIALLLLNALFSYLIRKFAAFFGLKPPCVFCSRIDHVLEPGKSHRDLLCVSHAAELSSPAKPSWYVFEITQKLNLVEGLEESSGSIGDGDNLARGAEEEDRSVVVLENFELGDDGRKKGEKNCGQEGDSELEQEQEGTTLISSYDASFSLLGLHSENVIDEERLIPVELIDLCTSTDGPIASWPKGVEDGDIGDVRFEGDSIEQIMALVSMIEVKDSGSSEILEMVGVGEEYPSLSPAVEAREDCLPGNQCVMLEIQGSDGIAASVSGDDSVEIQVAEVSSKAFDADVNCEISAILEPVHLPTRVGVQSPEKYNEITDNAQVIDTETINTNLQVVEQLSIYNEVEEERMPETPTSIEGIHGLHRRFFFERREFGIESLDGSVASEIEGGEVSTVDRLKSSLRAERKALTALYAEFEEERSASTISANQTMAMITRLQEEKAAMQMEALQYQRMMEEQSEYDQEALQLLNELMLKREKEKQELEKEIELYRKKVLLYETKERRTMLGSKPSERSGTLSASSSAEDSVDLSFGSHETDECFHNLKETNQNTPTDDALSSWPVSENLKNLMGLDESLAVCEEERLSILEELKSLEEKLFTFDDKELSNNLEAMDHLSEENNHDLKLDYKDSDNDEIFSVSGFSHAFGVNGKLHRERKNVSCRGKGLLPLFDAISVENTEYLFTNQEETDALTESISKFEIVDQDMLVIAEEVNNAYERLVALEADWEFLKHCISSLKKGDKGLELLQEILQHLGGLRNAEFQLSNAGDELGLLSA